MTGIYNPMLKKYLLLFMTALITPGWTQLPEAPPNPPADQRFKTDVLLILAHPDDETAIGSFLAKLIFDDGKRVSAIYLNRGNGGGNTIGNEQSMAMANIREIEVHRALAKFNIFNVWILDGKDTPGQDLFKSLHNVHHGAALEKIIRLIRLTKPEVIITWMPIFVAGENHGDHQAAGVLATEAFDLAGDPLVFPVQVTVPRDRLDIENYQEGLQPWQPKKIYYFSDRDERIPGIGPAFDIKSVSETKKIPYYQLAAELHTPHLVQGDVAQTGIQALRTNDFSEMIGWVSKFHVVFGKSLVPCQAAGNLFEGINSLPIPFQPARGYQPDKKRGIRLLPGGIFDFYEKFWKAHSVEHLSELIQPEIMVAGGSYLHLPLLISNDSKESVRLDLKSEIPSSWNVYTGEARYHLSPGEIYPAQTLVQTAFEETEEPVVIKWRLYHKEKQLDSFELKVYLREWTLPQ